MSSKYINDNYIKYNCDLKFSKSRCKHCKIGKLKLVYNGYEEHSFVKFKQLFQLNNYERNPIDFDYYFYMFKKYKGRANKRNPMIAYTPKLKKSIECLIKTYKCTNCSIGHYCEYVSVIQTKNYK